MRLLLREILDLLCPATPEACIKQDQDRLLRHDHGPYIWAGEPGTPSFMFGVGSGLYSLLFARLNPATPLFVIEQDASMADCFRNSLARMDLPNVHILNSAACGMETMRGCSSRLGVVGVSLNYADAKLLQAIQASHPMHVLFGEYHESRVGSLTIHETSRHAADHFHWLNWADEGRVAGCRTPGPLLSIVVSVYDVAKVLDRCLGSLSDQPLETMEIVVVDDGSRDGSGEICDRWAATDSRFRVIHEANASCVAARNMGLRVARGVYVGLVEGGDWVHPRMFPKLLEAAVRTGSDLAQCGYQEIFARDDANTTKRETWLASQASSPPAGPQVVDPRTALVSRSTICRRIYRRDFLKAHEIEFTVASRRFDDLPFQCATLALANRMSVIEDRLYYCRQPRSGQDIALNDERLYVHFAISRILRAFLNTHYSPGLERQLKRVQIATYYGGSTRIRRDLRKKYLHQTTKQYTNNLDGL